MRTMKAIGAGTKFVAALVACAGLATHAAGDIHLGSAQSFAVLGGQTVTNTGPSVITGDLGVWPGNTATGFPPGIVNGSIHLGDAVAQQAQADALVGYNHLASLAPTADLTGTDLGGLTLTPGVYFFSSSAFLTGTLTLDAQGDPDALFVFQIGSTLITGSNSSVVGINDATGCDAWWQVGSSTTLGTGTDFIGTIIAHTSITLNTDASIIHGRAFALNGSTTLDSNIIDAGPCIPTPGAFTLLGAACFGSLISRRRTT